MGKFFLFSKTILFGLLLAAAPACLTYLGGIDWVSLGISPPVAAGIGAAIVALRAVTSTAISLKKGS